MSTIHTFLILVLSTLLLGCEGKGFNYMTADLGDISKIKYNEVVTGELLPDLKEELDLSIKTEARLKRIACILTLRNLLAFSKEDFFTDVVKVMNETRFDKKLTFDKIMALKLTTCVNTITTESVEEILHPDKATGFHPDHPKLLAFDNSFFFSNETSKIDFSEFEKEILKDVFDDYNEKQEEENISNKTLKNEDKEFDEEINKIYQPDVFVFGIAISNPFVIKYLVIGAVSTTFFALLIMKIFSCAFFKKNEEEFIAEEKLSKKKRN